ncbi:MAG: hypothetical protein R3A79_18890 [Nannocystaceae bacterium]
MVPLPRRRSSPPLPSARDLGLPRSARGLYDRLCSEPVGDWERLLRECREHVADFEAALATNEFLPIAEARALAEAMPRLVERAREHPKRALAEHLAWIAARYFVIKDDGAHDFVVVGLDDDVAVYNAVVRHLEAPELALDLS